MDFFFSIFFTYKTSRKKLHCKIYSLGSFEKETTTN